VWWGVVGMSVGVKKLEVDVRESFQRTVSPGKRPRQVWIGCAHVLESCCRTPLRYFFSLLSVVTSNVRPYLGGRMNEWVWDWRES
jgi:hypothetical protein